RLTDDEGVGHTIYLPSLNVLSGSDQYFWISRNGSTYMGLPSQTSPDFSTLAQGAPVPWEARQTGYKVEVMATGFKLPVNIAFVPNPGAGAKDPIYYVTELYGTIKVVSRDGTVGVYAANLLNYTPSGSFPGSGEQGLTGVTIDPASGDVFTGMLYSS